MASDISHLENSKIVSRSVYDEDCLCPKCGVVLNLQDGFNLNDGCWTCTNCGEFLYGDVYEGEKFPGVMWHCDQCGAFLNKQDGFCDTMNEWICTECGHHEDFGVIINRSDESNTFKDKMISAFHKSIPTMIKAAKWTVGIGLAIGAALVTVALSSEEKGENDNEENKAKDDITYVPQNKSYQGYVPSGCSACGGPYPLCKDGCPAFDD